MSLRDDNETALTPSMAHRFLVTFLFHVPVSLGPIPVKLPSPLDIAFHTVSGLGVQVDGTAFREGGDNASQYFFPTHVTRNNLVLQRGVMKSTPVSAAFDLAMTNFKQLYFDVFIVLLNHRSVPVTAWTAIDAQPVKWEPGLLNAMSSEILINTIELSYRELRWGGVRR